MSLTSQTFGVSLDGLEFGANINSANPGVAGTQYFVPTQADIDALAAAGATTIRLPFSWERLQSTLGGPLNATYLGYIKQVVAEANAKGMQVILDCHNYGSYNGKLIGAANGPTAAQFGDFWGRIATAFAGNNNVVLSLMNEPALTNASTWLGAVNSAISAIGAAQKAAGQAVGSQEVLISGLNSGNANAFSTSAFAQLVQANLNTSQAFYAYGNIAFDVHQYLDANQSGQDTTTPILNASIAIPYLKGDTAWAMKNGLKLYLGETAVPDDAKSQAALTAEMEYIAANPNVWQGMSYWDASPYVYATDHFNIDPTTRPNAPQLQTMRSSSTAIANAVWLRVANAIATVSNRLIYSAAGVTNVAVAGSDDTLFLNSGFTGTVTGVNEIVNLIGADETLTLATGTNSAINIFGDRDVATVSGANVVAQLSGADDSITMNGAGDAATLTGAYDSAFLRGAGNSASYEYALLSGVGDIVTISGAYGRATLNGSGTATLGESATLTGANESVIVNGSYDVVNLNGVQSATTGETATLNNSYDRVTITGAFDAAILNGANDVANVYGADDTVTLNNAYDTVNATGVRDALTLNGSHDTATLSGASETLTLYGVGNTGTLNGVDTAATAETAIVAGGGDTVTLNGSYNSATMNGVGTSALHDTAIVNGVNDSVTINGVYVVATLYGANETASVAGSHASVTLNAANDVVTLSGSSNSAVLNGSGTSGIFESATDLGSNNSVTLNGAYDAETVKGTSATLVMNGAHDSATVTGANATLALAGTFESATLGGSGAKVTINGASASLIFVGGSATVASNSASETFAFNKGFGQVSISGFAAHETGTGHDAFSFSTSEFANFAALLGAARTSSGNTIITGANGDVLTLVGVTSAALAGLSADFTFHA